jgi:hypothetical protein
MIRQVTTAAAASASKLDSFGPRRGSADGRGRRLRRLIAASLTAAGMSAGLGAAASAADLGRPTPVPVYTKAPVVAPRSGAAGTLA